MQAQSPFITVEGTPRGVTSAAATRGTWWAVATVVVLTAPRLWFHELGCSHGHGDETTPGR